MVMTKSDMGYAWQYDGNGSVLMGDGDGRYVVMIIICDG